MIEPFQIAWFAFLACMGLLLLVLIEVHRINYRRQNEEMLGTKAFNQKVSAYAFTEMEIDTLDKITRASSFENKDAVLNSSGLFESAVTSFYETKGVFNVAENVLQSVENLRQKLNFTATNALSEISCTRQFNVGDRIDLVLEDGRRIKRSEIIQRSEKEWRITYDASDGAANAFLNKDISIRWTRPDDAIYSAVVTVRGVENNLFVLHHTDKLDKRQLRRWVREQVAFPVKAFFENGICINGMLLDLSAGGIMVGLPKECSPGEHLRIQFELPSFGLEDVEIEILRNLGHRNKEFPGYYCLTASFKGAFGWTQERVLQYLFEVNKTKKVEKIS